MQIDEHASHPRAASAYAALLRIGLFCAAGMFFNFGLGMWNDGQALVNPLSLGLSFLLTASGMFTAALALLPSVPRVAVWLILASCLALGLQNAYLSRLAYTPLTDYHSDNEMIGKYALEALKHGQNPYEWNFSDLTRVFRDPGLLVTPFLDGAAQNRLTYPALPVLTLWLFDRVGLGQVRFINLVFYVLLLILVFIGTPQKLRPVVLLPLLMIGPFFGIALSGAQDVVWSALLVGMVVAWKRPVLRTVLYGLAAAFHQQPWFIAPFLLIVIWRANGSWSERVRQAVLFITISVGLFLIVNLPFMVWNLREWWLGTVEPSYAAFNMYSQGLASLSVFGLASVSRDFYTALQAAFFATALIIHWRHARAIGPAFWIFPAIFFWLYYRGLANYWLFWLPPFLTALARDFRHNRHAAAVGVARPYRVTATVGMVGMLLAFPTLIAIQQPSASISATLEMPFITANDGQLLDQIRLRVSNDSSSIFRPRFAIQRDPNLQSLPWTILSGPEGLAPGMSADYTIGNEGSFFKAFSTDQSAQIVVSDADGAYSRRAVVTLPADSSVFGPDMIRNASFVYWSYDATLPTDWVVQASENSALTAAYQQVAGRDALSLTVRNITETPGVVETKLTQRVTFPGSVAIWVYPTMAMTPTAGEIYGMEIDDGVHSLKILFGSTVWQGVSEKPNTATVYIPAPLNAWSEQTIDLNQLYDYFKWSLPPFSVRPASTLSYPARQIALSLVVSSNQNLETTWNFGPITQDKNAVTVDHLVADALAHPALYYVYVGDQYRLQRNEDLALQAYLKALSADDHNIDAYWGIARSQLTLGNFNDAWKAFVRAVQLKSSAE